ncbi:hypothetical protein ACQKLP_16570 [Chitinophaga sp. NPDC101104]|uniref:hypothetical protein n=1 Tax=Chitinophaga sp. NPDC101104 TaxID=3390561 RepID=UPI003D077045
MTNYMHTDDLLPGFPDNPDYRSNLLPNWVKGLANVIVFVALLSLVMLFIKLSVFRSIGSNDLVMLLCLLLGICSGVAAAGLILEYEWAMRLSLLTSAGVLLLFTAFLGYDLFFFRTKIWTLVGIEIFVLTVSFLYFRALWKVRRDWELPRPVKPLNKEKANARL